MRGGQFASLGYHYGKGSTALTLHRGGKASTYHIVCVDKTTTVPLCQWVAVEALVESYAATLGKWFGLSDTELMDVLPGLAAWNLSQRNLGFMA